MARKHSRFALFADGVLVDTGTAEEIAERQNLRPEYVRWLSTPSRSACAGNRKYAIKLDDEKPKRSAGLKKGDAAIWGLHAQGRSVSEISALTGRSRESVRNIICGVWYDQNPRREEPWRG